MVHLLEPSVVQSVGRARGFDLLVMIGGKRALSARMFGCEGRAKSAPETDHGVAT